MSALLILTPILIILIGLQVDEWAAEQELEIIRTKIARIREELT